MKNETHKAGVGIAGVITLIFLVLKLTGLIDCKWSFIVAPLLIAFILRYSRIEAQPPDAAWCKWRLRK